MHKHDFIQIRFYINNMFCIASNVPNSIQLSKVVNYCDQSFMNIVLNFMLYMLY